MFPLPTPPKHIILIDIDGLRQDVLQHELEAGHLPVLGSLLGGASLEQGLQFQAAACLPSITYCCQASSITGAHPYQHEISGNVYFDRFGRASGGRARRYEFDFIDAPAVFLTGLLGKVLPPQIDTLYETAARYGKSSTVAFHMLADGAQHWLKPGLDDWRDFVAQNKAGFGQRFDNAMINDVLEHLQAGHRPNLLTLYFFGLDHESHIKGPGVQGEYLSQVIDPQLGRFVDVYRQLGLLQDALFVLFSDHGQVQVKSDDEHTLKVGMLVDRELGHLFDSVGLDVYDHPLEGNHCNAMLCGNGGLAHVYLKHQDGTWDQPPDFNDVLHLAQAFWFASHLPNDAGGQSAPNPVQSLPPGASCYDALSLILVRNTEADGWYSRYQVYTPHGLHSIQEYLAEHPLPVLDAANRLDLLAGPTSGDLLLLTNYESGFAFSLLPYLGVHGGLHPEDSQAVLAFSLPCGSPEQVQDLRRLATAAIEDRCRRENNRLPGNADVAYTVRALLGWPNPL